MSFYSYFLIPPHVKNTDKRTKNNQVMNDDDKEKKNETKKNTHPMNMTTIDNYYSK